jgi:hypothetical protein
MWLSVLHSIEGRELIKTELRMYYEQCLRFCSCQSSVRVALTLCRIKLMQYVLICFYVANEEDKL